MTSAAIVLPILQRAVSRLQAGDASRALDEIETALAIAPDDVEALHLRGMALGRAGRTDDATVAFERAAAVHPRKDVVLVNFGNMLKNAGRIAEARGAYERAAIAAPGSADAFNALGLACRQQGDTASARAAFERALKCDPRHAYALNNLATIEAAANRHELAVDLLTSALAVEKGMVSAYINRSVSLRTLGRLEGALADQRKAALLAPSSAEPVFQMAATLRTAGRFEEAADAYRTAIEVDPSRTDIHREFIGMAFETGKNAFSVIDEAIEKTRSSSLMIVRGETSLLAGDPGGAFHFAKRALLFSPDDSQAYRLLAKSGRALGDVKAALPAARRAVDLSPDDFESLHVCCEIEMANGDIRQAAARLRRDAPTRHLQKHLALKAIALRAIGDPDYRRIYDYDRLTAQIPIEVPDGYRSAEQFNEALAASISALHNTATRPVDQTLYGGTQSPGRFWNEPDPVIQDYVKAMRRGARRYVESLPDDQNHPFLSRKSADLDCVGAWSVVLSSGGGHVDHIHPAGWVSACYYVAAPKEIFHGSATAGHLRLGASGVAGLNLPAERYYPPTPGTVVFFPSYIWHGVEPFHAGSQRITAPFDLAPRP